LLDPNWAKKKRLPGDQPIAWPKAEEASRAVREYLAVLDAARSDERVAFGDDSGASGGGSRRKALKEVSLTDPEGMSRKEAHRPILCLRCKLSHRQQGWDHRRCRGHAR
jgi:hypothetical protein